MTKPTRQLAAILFSDIVGYTALMGKDEPRALDILRQSRNIQKSMIESHNGKWLKEMGDGVLAQFSSAVNAVQCALKIQEQANAELDAKIRIGIHLGDVSIENDDVFGDGVNIASRLQAIADPGGIYISESVKEAIRSHSEIKTAYIADVQLKNVDHPIKTYFLNESWLPVPTLVKRRQLSHKSSRSRIRNALTAFTLLAIVLAIWWYNNSNNQLQSIAVLPIANLSGNPENEVLMAGLHANLRDELALIRKLRIPGRITLQSYKETTKSIPEIARELDVEVLVESDLFALGENINLTVRMIKAFPEEQQLWSATYKKESGEILSVFDDIALAVADNMDIELSKEELAHFNDTVRVDPKAFQEYLRGLDEVYKLTRESIDIALDHFKKALDLDPNYAPAYIGIALGWGVQSQQGLMPPSEVAPYIEEATSKALELGDDYPEIHFQLAVSETWGRWNWEKAEQEYIRTLEIDPTHSKALAYYAHYMNIMQRFDKSGPMIEEALKLDPEDHLLPALYGMHLNHTRQHVKAIKGLNSALEKNPGNVTALSALWTNLHNLGRYDEAIETARILYTERRDYVAVQTLINGEQEGGYLGAMESLAEAYIRKSDTTYVTPWQICTLFTRAGNAERAMNWMEKAYEIKDPNMPYISCDPIFDNIDDHPRFQDLLSKMNLTRD